MLQRANLVTRLVPVLKCKWITSLTWICATCIVALVRWMWPVVVWQIHTNLVIVWSCLPVFSISSLMVLTKKEPTGSFFCWVRTNHIMCRAFGAGYVYLESQPGVQRVNTHHPRLQLCRVFNPLNGLIHTLCVYFFIIKSLRLGTMVA